MYSYADVFSDKQNILFVVAHPDDLIVFYGALLHKLRKDGKDVYIVTVTNGARGSRDNEITEAELAKIRLHEELSVLDLYAIPKENYTCLGYRDGEVESDYKLIGLITKYIRKFKAGIVCTHEPTAIYQQTYHKDGFFVQHRDHRKVAEAVVDSAYPFSRDKSFFPEHATEGIQPHTVYDIVMTDEIECNFDLDYTEDLEKKKAALRVYKSQMDESFVNDVVESVKFNGRYMERYFYVKLLW